MKRRWFLLERPGGGTDLTAQHHVSDPNAKRAACGFTRPRIDSGLSVQHFPEEAAAEVSCMHPSHRTPREAEGCMTHRRMWWLLSPGLAGEISGKYHRFDRVRRRTACGIQLPEAFGMFCAVADDAKAQRDKRCPACVNAMKTGRSP